MSLHLYTYGQSHDRALRSCFPSCARQVTCRRRYSSSCARSSDVLAAPVCRVHEWRTKDGDVLAALHEAADGYVIHFMRLARFEVSRDLSMVRCTPFRSCSPALMRHLFLDQMMPLLLSLAGEYVMHASAVEHDGRCHRLCRRERRREINDGRHLRACGQAASSPTTAVMVREIAGQFLVSAPYASLRLWEDSAAALDLGRGKAGHRTGKRRFQRGSRVSFAAGPLPLDAMCAARPHELERWRRASQNVGGRGRRHARQEHVQVR